MPKTFSYADAVKLLGAKESGLVVALDKILGGALLSGATLGISGLLSWFDAKADFIRLSHELLVKAAEKRSGLSRYNQTERVQAAHAVLVVVAFFEAVEELNLAVPVRELELDRNRQLLVLGLTDLFGGFWPLPSPEWPIEKCLHELVRRYDKSAGELLALFKAHAAWDELNETQQEYLAFRLGDVGTGAVGRYEQLWARVASAYPELRFWVQSRDGMATRAALARLETTLKSLVVGRGPDPRRAELARKYRAVLDRPIIEPDQVLPGLHVPPMGEAYVDPDFQVASYKRGYHPAAMSWWRHVPVRSDLYRYLVGYLTSPKAVSTPLLVLGDPGSGKSMLTRVLAARLPATDFLTVRVELRNTPTEADLVDQIQHGLRAALQEDISWADLARSAGDALPVVLLDGFDELLQATGVSQTRYLAKVEQFQRDRAETGHPVAVVVTSRISVCGGVHIPPGADVLRLVPFNDGHVTSWLEGWNAANAAYFANAGLAPLEPSVVLRYRDLAAQPLLLLMLALYDAGGNALQRVRGRIGEADLYERLLSMFARREVSKEDTDRTAADLSEDVETELERLSVVAFAMFNRGTQWVTEADLNADLAGLLEVEHSDRRPGMHTPLSPGEAVLGRFFFVQRSEALRDAHTLRTYEFLHATFGEFLVARFTLRVLYDLRRTEASRPRRLASSPVDDGELFALLSFAPLTSRRPVLDFLIELTHAHPERSTYADLVRRLFAVAREGRPRSRMAYEPAALPVPERHAFYSLNLVLLAIVLTGSVEAKSLGIWDWSRLAGFWKSQLSAVQWDTFMRTVNVSWDQLDSSLAIQDKVAVQTLTSWTPIVPAGITFDARLDSHFTGDVVSNFLRYPLESMLANRFHPGYAKALIDLGVARGSASGREHWYLAVVSSHPELVLEQLRADLTVSAEVLGRLADVGLAGFGGFWAQLFDRVGHGGPNHALLEVAGGYWPRPGTTNVVLSSPANVLDAWLRLHEGGFEFPAARRYPDTATLLTLLDLNAIGAIRPDLGTRAARALADFVETVHPLENGPPTGVIPPILIPAVADVNTAVSPSPPPEA